MSMSRENATIEKNDYMYIECCQIAVCQGMSTSGDDTAGVQSVCLFPWLAWFKGQRRPRKGTK